MRRRPIRSLGRAHCPGSASRFDERRPDRRSASPEPERAHPQHAALQAKMSAACDHAHSASPPHRRSQRRATRHATTSMTNDSTVLISAPSSHRFPGQGSRIDRRNRAVTVRCRAFVRDQRCATHRSLSGTTRIGARMRAVVQVRHAGVSIATRGVVRPLQAGFHMPAGATATRADACTRVVCRNARRGSCRRPA
jgi:hypothetical protein